ncbi:MAG TPA: Uma2 family endonuclease [Longimicrobiaceae bacterium]|nr:Uma2 family endonuclease [Longimicrobiaceae bacterium]
MNHLQAIRAFQRAGFWIARQSKHVIMTDGTRILTIPARTRSTASRSVGSFATQALRRRSSATSSEVPDQTEVPALLNGYRTEGVKMHESSTSGWTYSEYARLPADRRYEVARGEVIGTPSPSPYHQLVVGAVCGSIYEFAERRGTIFLGPVDVLLGEGDYLVPDLVWVRRERMGIVSDRGIEAAPDLIVEVTSPATADRDRGIKRERYANYGVPHYWIVDPLQRQVEVYRMLEDPTAPHAVARESFTWTPAADTAALEIDVPELFADLDRVLSA